MAKIRRKVARLLDKIFLDSYNQTREDEHILALINKIHMRTCRKCHRKGGYLNGRSTRLVENMGGGKYKVVLK